MTTDPSPSPARPPRKLTELAKALRMSPIALSLAIDKGQAPATWADDAHTAVEVPKSGSLFAWARRSGLSSLPDTCAAAPHSLGDSGGPLCIEHLRALPPPGSHSGTILETIRTHQRSCAPNEWGTNDFSKMGIDAFTVRLIAEGMVAAGESVKGRQPWSFKSPSTTPAAAPQPSHLGIPELPTTADTGFPEDPPTPPPAPPPEAPPPTRAQGTDSGHALLQVVLDEVAAAVTRIRQRVTS